METLKKFINLINQDINKENESKSFTVTLRWSYCLMAVYFLCFFYFCLCSKLYTQGMYVIPWICFLGICLFLTYRISGSKNFFLYCIALLSWVIMTVFVFGWNCGSQHFMLPLLLICFFSIHASTLVKFGFMGALILLRMSLFFYCQDHAPFIQLSQSDNVTLQILNTIFLFLHMAIVCLIFSTTIQDSEKKLLAYNQKLEALASTDPLTQLPNRRFMINLMEKYAANHPKENFCIALGDIDLFKRINDTRGHNCGDDVLKSLSQLFREKVKDKGYVCRWGGEEFFFFLPGMNLDQASILMNEINIDVSQLTMYDKTDRFYITMTFGVEENDYVSAVSTLVSRADEKLYYGKEHGRNQVVF